MPLSGLGASSARELESAVPKLPFGRVFLLALGLLACSVGGLEGWWHSQSLLPNAPNTVDLWRFWRARIYGAGGRVVVFLGTSRIRGDVDLELLRRSYPRYRFVQLGISGNVSPVGTLRALSLDTAFHGIVVCELAAPFLEPSRWGEQREYFAQPLKSYPVDGLVHAYLRDHAAVLDPRLGIAPVVQHWFSDYASIVRPRCRAHFDRSLSFSDVPVTSAVGEPLLRQKPIDDSSLMEGLTEVRECVRRIQAEKGSVVLVTLPSNLPSAPNAANSGFKNLSWERIAEITGAVCIPLDRGDSLGPFRCSDEVHLGTKQAERLTQYFASELRRKNVLD
jgi:hypothetical protein